MHDKSPPPPNRRPTAKNAAAARRVVARRWRRRRRRKRHDDAKPKDGRTAALRLRELQALFRFRHGAILPADDIDSLEILVGYATIAGKRPEMQIETWARWCDPVEAERMIWSARNYPVWHDPDPLAHRLGLTYAVRMALGIRTIGSVDVGPEERDRLRRQRGNEKRRKKPNAETIPITKLNPREKVVLAAIGETETTAASIVEQVKGHRAFRGLASVRQEVHRILDRLRKMGLVVDRSEPRPQGSIRYVQQRQQSSAPSGLSA